jgi:radical SAM superfamily enzyme YgiQ (UPF0313 family)
MLSGQKIRRVLLIDIPTYEVDLIESHRGMLEKRLRAQSLLLERRIGTRITRPGLSYSRGLLTIAASLERRGFSVRYLNYSDGIEQGRLLQLAREADAIGITVITPVFEIVKDICDRIKDVNHDVRIVLGGPHVTARPKQTLELCHSADYAMVGECEFRLPALLTSIENPDEVAGTAYRENDAVRISSADITSIAVSETPLPAYHLLRRSISDYAHNIKTARGCPYKCRFCSDRLSWQSSDLSQRNVQQVFQEIEMLSKFLPSGTLVHFSDAVFNLDQGHTEELVDLLFSFDTRVDLVQGEQVRALVDAGFVLFRLGFESLYDDVLDISAKSITYEEQRKASEMIRRISDRAAILAYMLVGLPGTTRESILMDAVNIRRAVEDDLVDFMANKILVPYPGTPYYDEAASMGILIQTREWERYDRRSYPVYRLENLSSDEIYFGYLLQQAVLAQAYLDNLEAIGFTKRDLDAVTSGLDYVYSNYIQSSARSKSSKSPVGT